MRIRLLSLKEERGEAIQKVYEVDPFICEKCGHEMKVVAVITNTIDQFGPYTSPCICSRPHHIPQN
jgi:hypothetical protein